MHPVIFTILTKFEFQTKINNIMTKRLLLLLTFLQVVLGGADGGARQRVARRNPAQRRNRYAKAAHVRAERAALRARRRRLHVRREGDQHGGHAAEWRSGVESGRVRSW